MMKNKMLFVWTIIVLCAVLCGCGGGAVVQDELLPSEETVAQEEPVADVETIGEDEAPSTKEIIPAVMEEVALDISQQEDAEVVYESEAVVDTIRQESPSNMDYSYDVTVEEVESTADVDPPPSEIPSMTISAKTGAEDTAAEVTPILEVLPVLEPVVVTTADLDTVMAAANGYAASVYGCIIDTTLDMGNSSYHYPAYASADADQATVESKARDIVDYTF